jgi:hypothetical protein
MVNAARAHNPLIGRAAHVLGGLDRSQDSEISWASRNGVFDYELGSNP